MRRPVPITWSTPETWALRAASWAARSRRTRSSGDSPPARAAGFAVGGREPGAPGCDEAGEDAGERGGTGLLEEAWGVVDVKRVASVALRNVRRAAIRIGGILSLGPNCTGADGKRRNEVRYTGSGRSVADEHGEHGIGSFRVVDFFGTDSIGEPEGAERPGSCQLAPTDSRQLIGLKDEAARAAASYLALGASRHLIHVNRLKRDAV